MTAAHPHPPARHRIGCHADADADGSEPWYWFVCDERWRMVATYRASDANPKERFVYHNAGLNGYGGSSYIDSTILRDTDDAADWVSAAPDSTLQTRYYYLQNWRADVVALIEPDGDPIRTFAATRRTEPLTVLLTHPTALWLRQSECQSAGRRFQQLRKSWRHRWQLRTSSAGCYRPVLFGRWELTTTMALRAGAPH